MDGAGRRVRGEGTWAAARDAYLAGASAGEVCERYDLGLTALRVRARREGWRRSDRPDPELDGDDPDADPDADDEPDESGGAEADPDPDPDAMAEQAWRRAARALTRGRMREAQGWSRLARELHGAAQVRREAQRQAAASAERALSTLSKVHDTFARIRAAEAKAKAADGETADPAIEPHSAHSTHSSHRALEVEAPAPETRPLNRAERRRRARLAPTARARDGP